MTSPLKSEISVCSAVADQTNMSSNVLPQIVCMNIWGGYSKFVHPKFLLCCFNSALLMEHSTLSDVGMPC